MDQTQIFAIERPHPSLLKVYVARAMLTGPALVFTLPVMLCRYYTLRYRFDASGIRLRWGLIFRREVNLSYSRIQDIHLVSGVIQRWFGLADIQVQTASGNAQAEMLIEGVPEYEELRNFLYSRMRGTSTSSDAPADHRDAPESEPAAPVLMEILAEIKAARAVVEKFVESRNGGQ